MHILPRGGQCNFFLLYAACRHCVIGIGPFIRIAVIACVTFPRAAILLLQNFGDIIFSCRS